MGSGFLLRTPPTGGQIFMATIFEQALKELDEVKRGLSTSNAVLFKGTIQAAEKAEDALKAFQSASAAASGHLEDMLKVQSILTGKSAARATRGAGGTREKTPCLKCLAEGVKPPKMGLGGRVGRFCDDHKDILPAEKKKLKDKA